MRICDANKLLENFNITTVPDIAKLVKYYDFKIILFGYELAGVGENVKGFICINNKNPLKNKRIIAIRDDMNYSSKRFIAAYLFSLYQLKGNDDNYVEKIYDESMFDEEVYKYTLNLLLPDSLFNDLYTNIGDKSLLMEVFKVSDVVIEEKIKRLKKEK